MYDATGKKWRKIVKDGVSTTTYDYFDGVEYKNSNLEAIYNFEGRVTKTTTGAYNYEYTLNDHLGNGRVYSSNLDNNNNVLCQVFHHQPINLRNVFCYAKSSDNLTLT